MPPRQPSSLKPLVGGFDFLSGRCSFREPLGLSRSSPPNPARFAPGGGTNPFLSSSNVTAEARAQDVERDSAPYSRSLKPLVGQDVSSAVFPFCSRVVSVLLIVFLNPHSLTDGRIFSDAQREREATRLPLRQPSSLHALVGFSFSSSCRSPE